MKAVILAGGEGKRLRPLTDNTPKPMTLLFSKPILEYMLQSLAESGFEEAVITLRYLPETVSHYFGEEYRGMKLKYITEQAPRGTAGAVKDAAVGFEETFLVVSGDGLCRFDFNGILDFHKAAGSECTVVCREVREPGEYGLVRKGDNNRILSFSEKPGWNRTDGNLANTGVYVLEPSVLAYIPDGGSVDFAADIFPQLLQNDAPFYAYQGNGYWCDIGEAKAYKACHRAVFDRDANIALPSVQKDIYATDKLPSGSYTVIPPVFFGNHVTVGKDAVIGPYTVVGDGCTIGRGASVRKSVLHPKVFCGEDVLVSDSILCNGAAVKKGCRIFEDAVVGENSVIGENSTVGAGVVIASDKHITKNSIVSENVTESSNAAICIENGTIEGAIFTEIPASAAAALGAAFGSAKTGKYLAAGCDGKNSSKAVLSAVSGGAISAGANIWNMGRCFRSEFLYILTYSGMNGGVFVSTDSGIVKISLFGEHGLPLDRKTERDCEYRFRRSDFSPCNPEYCGSVRDMSYLTPMYRRQLGLFKNEYYGARSFFVDSENEDIRDFCRDFFGRHCVEEHGLPIFTVSADGAALTVADEMGEFASHDKLLALCCYDEFLQGNDVAMPYDAPKVIGNMAHEHHCHTLRFCDEDDAAIEEHAGLIANCIWSRDALFMLVKLLDMCIRYGTDLHGLLKQLPVFFVYEKSLAIDDDGAHTGEILRRLREQSEEHSGAGIRLQEKDGEILITAASQGKRIRILTEAATEETAIELCGVIEDRIHEMISAPKCKQETDTN